MAKLFKKPRVSTFVFYGFLLTLIIAFLLLMSSLMGKLKTHLEKYQASHINTQYRQVFEEYFEDPDWAALYEQAGMVDTEFESKEAFAAYMEAKVGSQELICFLESNGTNSKRCPVYLGNEEIGAFYIVLIPEAKPEKDPWYYKIPFAESLVNKLKVQRWKYDGLELVQPERELSVTVTTEDNRIVYINGVPLGQQQLISTTHTKIDSYLPEGVQGMRRQSFYQDGLLVKPEVTVTDLNGNPIAIRENAPGYYSEVFAAQEQEPELEQYIISAAQTYCRYMIVDARLSELSPYYDTSSKIYQDITSTELWGVAKPMSTRLGDASVTEFYRYNDEIVTARVQTVLYAMRYDGTEREYPLDTTFFLRKAETGEYKIFASNNMDLQETTTMVRLRFFVDGQLLESRMVDASSAQLALPSVEVPEGKRFAGWYQATTDETGNQTLSLIFLPKEGENTVFIPSNTSLTVMDLQALFE